MKCIPISYQSRAFGGTGFRVVLILLTLIEPMLVLAADSAAFPKPYDTRQHDARFLKPDEAVKTFHLPSGFHVSLFAGEPDVQQPIGMTLDPRGRLWVAENYTYSERPLSWDTNLCDRIIILEDTNQDGHFDRRTVFWDRAKKLTSVAVGFGGVYALCPPQLLFIPDRNEDDVPDSEPQVLLDGFEDTVVWHNIANGLKFGPDGWLYGRQGIQGVSHVGAPDSSPEQRTTLNAGIWRFHPVTHKFEVVAQGTTNPWGTDWDDNGQLFFINTVIGHFWHVIPGAYYQRMYGEHARQHLYELIDQTADHFHWDTREAWSKIREIGVSPTTSQAGGGHAHCGMMVYLGDNWPDRYRDSMFTVNFHGKRVNNDVIQRQGATYTAHHAPDFLTVDDPWFRGVDLLYGPDGGVYLSDWSDIGECHNADGINRTSGRIYKITYGEIPPQWTGDLQKLDNHELVDLQLHHNDWLVRQARQVLQERAVRGDDVKSVHASLRELFDSQKEVHRKLRALWALYVTGGTDEAWLRKLLRVDNEQLRVWAVQLLVDQRTPSEPVLKEFADLATTDRSGLVLTFLASAMRRAPLDQRWPIATALAGRSEFAEDPVLPLMIWYGIEPAVPQSPEKAAAFARASAVPKLCGFVARRLFEEGNLKPASTDPIVELLRSLPESKFLAAILNGISEALNGVHKPAAPTSWSSIGSLLAGNSDPAVSDRARELSALFGDPGAIENLKSRATDANAEVASRRQALQTLLRVRPENLTPVLVKLLDDNTLAPDSIRALAAVGDPQTPALLLGRYQTFSENETRTEVINALASRSTFATNLLEAVHRGVVPRKDVGPTQVRQLRSLKDPDIDSRLSVLWPQLDDSPSAKRELLTRYKALLTSARLQAADPSAGRQVFKQACALCHTLFGEGAKIGPELTGADRRNLDYLLENILDPSAVVPENYRAWVITLKDDRVLNGIIAAKNDQTITLQTSSEKVVLPRSEIDSMAESQLSMMPEGLLQALTEQQAADLIAYLMSPGKTMLAK